MTTTSSSASRALLVTALLCSCVSVGCVTERRSLGFEVISTESRERITASDITLSAAILDRTLTIEAQRQDRLLTEHRETYREKTAVNTRYDALTNKCDRATFSGNPLCFLPFVVDLAVALPYALFVKPFASERTEESEPTTGAWREVSVKPTGQPEMLAELMIDVSVPGDSAIEFGGGQRRIVVSTDDRGRASVPLSLKEGFFFEGEPIPAICSPDRQSRGRI